jgi:hypothetical protein
LPSARALPTFPAEAILEHSSGASSDISEAKAARASVKRKLGTTKLDE